MAMGDSVNHPDHYNAHPVCEAIDICEHLPFSLGNAVKYLWRAGMKDDATEDLRKGLWYMRRHADLLAEQRVYGTATFPPEVVALAKVLHKNPRTPPLLREFFRAIREGHLVSSALADTYAGARATCPGLSSEPEFRRKDP